MKTTRTFEKILEAFKTRPRLISVKSGMRCGKTRAITQLLILYALHNANKVITIIAPTIRHIRTGVWRDIQAVLQDDNITVTTNLSNFSLKFGNGTVIDCVAYLETGSEMAKGHQQNVAFFTECTESADYEIYKAVAGRTSEWMIADWNPSVSRNWWFQTQILNHNPQDGSIAEVQVTLDDNQYLSQIQKEQIYQIAEHDERFRKVYLEGDYADTSDVQIITNYIVEPHAKFVEEFEKCSQYASGLDLGYVNSFNVLAEIGTQQGELWIRQCFYDKGWLNNRIAEEIMKANLHNKYHICIDNEMKTVDELNGYAKGKFRVQATKKFAGSVVAGYNNVKKFRLHIDSDAEQMINDIQKAEWVKDRQTGEVLNVVNKQAHDPHALDAISYCINAFFSSPNQGYKFYTA